MNFNQITNDAVLSASSLFNYRKYEQGEVIYNEGDNAEYFYGIIKGKVSVRKKVVEIKENNTTNIKKARKSIMLGNTGTGIGGNLPPNVNLIDNPNGSMNEGKNTKLLNNDLDYLKLLLSMQSNSAEKAEQFNQFNFINNSVTIK